MLGTINFQRHFLKIHFCSRDNLRDTLFQLSRLELLTSVPMLCTRENRLGQSRLLSSGLWSRSRSKSECSRVFWSRSRSRSQYFETRLSWSWSRSQYFETRLSWSRSRSQYFETRLSWSWSRSRS